MAKNLKDNDVVYAVRIIDNVPQIVRGVIHAAGSLDCYVDWDKPKNSWNIREHNEDLHRTPQRAVTAFLRKQRRALMPKARHIEAIDGVTQYNLRIKKATTDSLQEMLTPWAQQHVKKGSRQFAYYIYTRPDTELVLIRAYKTRTGKIKYHSITEMEAIYGQPVSILYALPEEIKPNTLWYLSIPQPWNKWINRPRRDETLYGRKRKNDYTENT